MKIGVVGATGAVGREILNCLAERGFADGDFAVQTFASPRSEGMSLLWGKQKKLKVAGFNLKAVQECDFVLMSAGGAFSKQWAEAIVSNGRTVLIDNSSAWRSHPEVPLIVPEVNSHELTHFKAGIIANPNCSTIQLVVSLLPLQKHFGLETIVVSTYQAVSGSGQKGIEELSSQVEANFQLSERPPQIYPQTIAFNLVPVIGAIAQNGYCEEEEKIIYETKRILGAPHLEVLVTTVRVPVFNVHSEAVTVCLLRQATLAELHAAFASQPGIVFTPNASGAELPSPLRVAGKDEVFVSRVRLRHNEESSRWLQFWNVADNLRKGAATNAVQILERLLNR